MANLFENIERYTLFQNSLKDIVENIRQHNLKAINDAYKAFRVAVEEADSRSFSEMGNGILASIEKMAEIDPSIDNTDRAYRTLNGFFDAVQMKATRNFMLNLPNNKYSSLIKSMYSLYTLSFKSS